MQFQSRRPKWFVVSISALAALSPGTLHAHPLHNSMSGLTGGLLHPFAGLDHILAMVAVGFWAAQLGGRARWLVSASFLAMMTVGGATGFGRMPVPFVEQGIAASFVVFGLLIAVAARLPVWGGMALVGFFALFHGHAHAAEMTYNVAVTAYAIGFVLATAGLHLAGITLGVLAQCRGNLLMPRLVGISVIVAGLLSCWA